MLNEILDLSKDTQVIEISEDIQLSALFVGRDSQQIKSKVEIVHSKPNLTSRIRIKAVLFDSSKADFEGLLKINKGAKGSDTYLKIDCLVMSESASARAVPSLEIFEDEVKAGHGATIGYLDLDMINYLQMKGLSKRQSEKLIVDAFINS